MKEFFRGVKKIRYEGPDSKNPLAFRHYRAKEKVGAKTMEEHLRFSVVFWHTFKGTGSDPFGGGVYERPWDEASDPMERLQQRGENPIEPAPSQLGRDFQLARRTPALGQIP